MSGHERPLRSDYRQVVLTGGPGAGKTAVLEIVRKQLCSHVLVVPESASIIFKGGFPRHHDEHARRAAQVAIYSVQRQLERFAHSREGVGLSLCDRGTIDGLAYWPGEPADYWREIASTRDKELSRYAAVIHLHTPTVGYDRSNGLRVETVEEAAAIDKRIAEVWREHPHRFDVEASPDFLAKVSKTIGIIDSLLPTCCRRR